MRMQGYSGSTAALSDERLGTVAVSLVVSELQWAPDVAPAAMDRIARDAVAYPEQFDRRPPPPQPSAPAPVPSERSARRAISRLAVITVILAVIVAVVIIAATATGAEASALADRILILASEAQ